MPQVVAYLYSNAEHGLTLTVLGIALVQQVRQTLLDLFVQAGMLVLW
jgi:hypothetical protein